MSGGRKLQDIFDGGTRRLEQLEQSEKQNLESSASAAVEACGRKESQVMQFMEATLNAEEGAIFGYTTAAMEAVTQAITAEEEENERFYASLIDSLRLSLRSLTDDIARVRESLIQKSTNDAEYRLAVFETELNTLTTHLRANGIYASEQLHTQARARFLEFAARMESIAATLFEKESAVPAELQAQFADKSHAAYQALEQHSVAFAQLVDRHLVTLDETARELALTLEDTATEHATNLDKDFEGAETRLRSSYDTVLATALQSRHALSTSSFDELQEGLESGRRELASKLAAFRADSESFLDQLKQSMTANENVIRERAAAISSQAEESITAKLEAARTNRDLVATERTSMLQKISKDLQEIESGFETRLSDISRDCLARLSTICLDAETSIVTAHDNCVKEFRATAEATQVEMENRATSLLKEFEDAENVAIALIKAAAGEAGEQA